VGFDARNDDVDIDPVANGSLPTVASALSLVHPCSGSVTASWSGELTSEALSATTVLLVEAGCTAGGCPGGTVEPATPNRVTNVRLNYVVEASTVALIAIRTAGLHVVWPSLPAGTYTSSVRLAQSLGVTHVSSRTLLVHTLGPDACPPASRCE
jgi:hypothetical protein